MTQILNLPYPISVNRYWRKNGHHIYLSQEGSQYKNTVKQIGMINRVKQLNGFLRLSLTIQPKLTKSGKASKILIDIDNGNKGVLDALQGVLYEDDKQVKELHITYGEPVLNGGLIVEISQL